MCVENLSTTQKRHRHLHPKRLSQTEPERRDSIHPTGGSRGRPWRERKRRHPRRRPRWWLWCPRPRWWRLAQSHHSRAKPCLSARGTTLRAESRLWLAPTTCEPQVASGAGRRDARAVRADADDVPRGGGVGARAEPGRSHSVVRRGTSRILLGADAAGVRGTLFL